LFTIPNTGLRWPFVVAGSIVTLIFDTIWLSMPLYTNIRGHFAYFYLLTLGVRDGGISALDKMILTKLQTTAGPLILNWISEITGADVRDHIHVSLHSIEFQYF
jgi:hypothetical protein